MIIIGDAAHAASPSTGQGASMAIEDALVLAQCLRDVPDIPPLVLKRFARLPQDWLFRYEIDWDARIRPAEQAA